MKPIALALCAVVLVACNKKSEDAGAELAATASTVNVAAGTSTVTVNQGSVGVAPGPKSVVVGGHAGGVQVQVGNKKIEVAGGSGQIDISGLTGPAAKAVVAAPAPAPAAPNAPAVPNAAAPRSGPCAQLAAKCAKCALPGLKQTCNLAVSTGDPASCQNGLNDRDVQANCK